MAFPIVTSTAEIISVLSGASDAPIGKKVTGSMRLYLRERGQGESQNSSGCNTLLTLQIACYCLLKSRLLSRIDG
jgi:hypothetical protein